MWVRTPLMTFSNLVASSTLTPWSHVISDREKAWLMAFPPMPLHPQGLQQKNALVFGKKLANWGKAPFLAGPPCAFSGAPMCQPFRAYHPYRVSAGKESLPLSQN